MTDQEKRDEIDLSLKLFIVLSRAFRAIANYVEKDIKSHNLNPSEFQVLELLYHKGDQPIQKIGSQVLLASASMTYVVDKLEKKELIKRVACPKDRRVTYASITPEGRQLIEQVMPSHKEAIHKIFEGLDAEEKRMLIELLKKVGYRALEEK